MKKFIVSTLCCIGLLHLAKAQEMPVVFTGNWLSKEFISQLEKGVTPKKIKAEQSCIEIWIDPSLKDSLWLFCDNKEQRKLGYRRVNNILRVFDSSTKIWGDISILPTTGELIVKEFKTDKIHRYEKARSSNIAMINGKRSAQEKTINEVLIVGNYVGKDGKKKFKVDFSKNGAVSGLANISAYSICSSGDCMKYSQNIELIFFTSNGSVKTYGWEKSKDSLFIYDLKTISMPGEAPRYKPVEKLYSLLKK